MKKIICTWLLAMAVLPTFSQSLFDQYKQYLTEPRTYTCFRATEALNIDGKLDESSWMKAAPTEPFVDISGEGFPTPKYETTAKMLWDDDYLYIGAILEEENIKAKLTQRDTIIYYDNDFEVFIDPDNNGQGYFELETNARGVLFDLILDKPYRTGGSFLIPWNCEGIKLAIHHEGTLNNPTDKDKYWSVEMAIPHKAVTWNFENPLKAGNIWRINFSRVQWLKEKGPEENWVWTPTGKIDMHMPDRWGYLYLADSPVGSRIRVEWSPACPSSIYKLMWAMFYAQLDAYSKNHSYLQSIEQFSITDKERTGLPAGTQIDMEATPNLYRISITDPNTQTRYFLNNEGRFWSEK